MDATDRLFQPVVQRRASDNVAKQILQLTESLRLRPGDKLPSERDMRDQLQVSRTTLREAIRLLESQGVLEVRQGLGTFVSDRPTLAGLPVRWSRWVEENKEQLLELLQVRAALEPLAAGLAAQRASEQDVRKMTEFLDQLDAAVSGGDLDRAVKGDIAFHQSISECGGNSFLVRLNADINVSLLESRYAYYSLSSRAEVSRLGHRRILEGIAAGDPESASNEMREHVASAIAFYENLDTNQQG